MRLRWLLLWLPAFTALGFSLAEVTRKPPPPPPKVDNTEACVAWWFGADKPDFKAVRKRICNR
jgi:hypothetical protein